MLGAILGDIIGSRFEFSPLRKNKSEDFELFGDKSDDCYFTDDTVLTIATADAIMNNKSFEDSYHYWGNKYPESGYGMRFADWLVSENKKPYNSFGNGSAMRVSPVSWLYDNLSAVYDIAIESAKVTHNHIEGSKGACAIACAIYLARKKASKEIIKEYIELDFNYDLSRTIKEIRPSYNFNETCQGSVPESIICFLEGSSYEDVVRKAISLGGDTDTQACIAGSIAEAYYGIPENLIVEMNKYLTPEMKQIIFQFNTEKYNKR